MRQGRLFKRCTKCGGKIPDRRCPKCGADSFSWAYVVDIAPAGEPRQQRSKAGFKTKADAVAAMAELQTTKAAGTYVEANKATLGDFLDSWVKGIDARAWTRRGYESVIRTHIKPALGTRPLQSLTKAEIRAFYSDLRRTGYLKGRKAGQGLSEKSVHNVHICLRAALNTAVENGLLRVNPASRALEPPKSHPEMQTWTAEELNGFLDHVRDERLFPFYRLAAFGGMRRGELLGLRWSDVKWTVNSISVQRQLGLDDDGDGTPDLVAPKTDHGRRSISLDAETVAILKDWQARQEFERRSWGKGYHGLDLVFCREDGTPYEADAVTDHFQRWVKSAGMGRIRFHDIRHTHATLLLESGADISVVSKRLGHANVGFTAKVYAHVTDTLSQATADRFSAYLNAAGSAL